MNSAFLTETLIIGILVGTFSQIFSDELKAWTPWITEKILRFAVRLLPYKQSKRFSEEWRSHMNEVPGHIGKLMFSIGLIRAALKISSFSAAESQELSAADRFLKRYFDIIMSCEMLIVLSPLMLFVCILIKKDGGPIFSKQALLGSNASAFYCLRFRTTPNSGAAKTTALMSFIYRTSLDNLPMLINVLKGDMSLVGPSPEYFRRNLQNPSAIKNVRPGILGLHLIQLQHPHGAYIASEKSYFKDWSIWRDIYILWKMVPLLLYSKHK